MSNRVKVQFCSLLLAVSCLCLVADAGIIKDFYNKVTGSSNKTEELVKQSVPICGNTIFSTSNESSVSPEIIFITSHQSRVADSGSYSSSSSNNNRREQRAQDVIEVAREFRFNAENVTLQDLERHGFNPRAPVTFLMHGFTSGYPLQAWMSAIVEAYTIDRSTEGNHYAGREESSGSYEGHNGDERRRHEGHGQENNYNNHNNYNSNQNQHRPLNHNLFIVNWNYGARGINYPRAVANIPIVANFVTRFINDKMLGDARISGSRIQLIGHSLGAHLAGFIGKNTRVKVGRIYGLDPAGPCFGTLAGPLYPADKRLAPSDAEEVITLHTNTALLGIEKPLGKYSIFVEGGSVQPGCKGGGVLGSLSALTLDGESFDSLACSHSRAPNLLTYRHDQSDNQDDCQLVAFECKDWDSFNAGHCGYCPGGSSGGHHRDEYSSDGRGGQVGPMRPVECFRIGLNWQYPGEDSSSGHGMREPSWQTSTRRPYSDGYQTSGNNNYGTSTTRRSSQTSTSFADYNPTTESYGRSTTRRGFPASTSFADHTTESYGSSSTRRYANNYTSYRPNEEIFEPRGESSRSSSSNMTERRAAGNDESVATKSMFLRTGDTQPYCVYQYQVVLELLRPFPKKEPPMSLVLQDSDSRNEQVGGSSSRWTRRKEQNSLTNDDFGNWFDDTTYTHLMTSSKKLGKVDHATMLFRDSLPGGHEILKALHVNYLSHSDPEVRSRFSSRLCPVRSESDHEGDFSADKRFYFKPCDGRQTSSSSSSYGSSTNRPARPRPTSSRRPNI